MTAAREQAAIREVFELREKLAAAEARIAAALAMHPNCIGRFTCPQCRALSVDPTGTEGGGGHE
jgi:hypothetical protein